MKTPFHFTFERDWRAAPLAFWVHTPPAGAASPLAHCPEPVPHRGYPMLRVEIDRYELCFSAPAQLDHFIEILSANRLPTSRQLSARLGLAVGPNGHWLSRLPAELKSPRKRFKLAAALRVVREIAVTAGSNPSFHWSESGYNEPHRYKP